MNKTHHRCLYGNHSVCVVVCVSTHMCVCVHMPNRILEENDVLEIILYKGKTWKLSTPPRGTYTFLVVVVGDGRGIGKAS